VKKLAINMAVYKIFIKRHGSVSRQVHAYRETDRVSLPRPKVKTNRDYQISIKAEPIELISSIDNAYPNYIIKICLFLLYVL